MHQETVSVVAGVQDAKALTGALVELAKNVKTNSGENQSRLFAAPDLGIHFARFAVIGEDLDARLPSHLVFESNFDTDLEVPEKAREEHLTKLAMREHLPLHSLYEHCRGFSRLSSPYELAVYLCARTKEATASYQGHIDRDLERIRLERRVRDVVLSFLGRAARAPQAVLYEAVRDHVRRLAATDPELAGLDVDHPAPKSPDSDVRRNKLRHAIRPFLVNSGPLLELLPRLPRILRWEHEDEIYDDRARQEAWTDLDRKRFRAIADTEDHGMQNALTHVVPLRSGAERLSVLRHAHAFIDHLAKRNFDDIGELGGIPSIHFAKWLLIDDGARLLFFSNYDGAWESYLGDFVDQAAYGLNLAWFCTLLYPRTHFVLTGGAEDEERFKAWGRAYQVPTQIFYSAYPDMSAAVINNNTWIRYGLHHPPVGAELDAWFRRLT